jgi:broad specificity phosphatase PhoE
MVLRLGLICYAPTRAIRASSFPSDEALDDAGLKEARAAAGYFPRGIRCLASPALAARQTAEALGLSPSAEPELRDCDYGGWAGRSLEALQADDPHGIAQWLSDPAARPHGGESLAALLRRVAAWLEAQTAQTGKIVAVTHASIVRAAIIQVLHAPLDSFWRIDIAPLSATWLHRNQARWVLAGSNLPIAG